jgi:FKBP-type peptidyl-prolyl cis-trans isomerase FklB
VTLKFAMPIAAFFAIAMMLGMSIASAQTVPADKNPGQAPTTEHGVPAKAAGSETPANAEPQSSLAASSGPATQPVINSHDDRISYASGADLARDIKRQGKAMNVDLFMRALTDGLAGRPLLMTDEEVTATMKAFEQERREGWQHAEMMIAERNRREGEAFFAENAKKDGVVTLPSGLQYKIIKKGGGKAPTLGDVVVCNYTGKLLDGTEIDSSYKRKEPTAVPVKGLIPGWTQALQLMPVGSNWQLFIPPQLAFGDKATQVVGPNSTLVFEVELLSIQEKTQTAHADKDKIRSTTEKGLTASTVR